MWTACYTQPEVSKCPLCKGEQKRRRGNAFQVKQLRELQLAALRETLAASLDSDTCALGAPEVENEWSEVEVVEEQLPEEEPVEVGDDEECSDGLCVKLDEVAPPKSGLLGRILNLISGGR